MRATQRLDLLNRIARELQSRYTYNDIDSYLKAYGIQTPLPHSDFFGKFTYVRRYLDDLNQGTLDAIASDLEIDPRGVSRAPSLTPPKNWEGTNQFRLFISHIAEEKDKAMRLRDCLSKHAISGFVAHEDIKPTKEWQVEIERALRTMDAFLAMHTKGFSQSVWTQQEVGFAVCSGVKIISLKMGEDPTGFISKHQALSRAGRTAELIAAEVDALLSDDELTASKLLAAQMPF